MTSTETSKWTGETLTAGDSRIEVSELIGSGAQGAVYALSGDADRVVKIFNRERRGNKRAKIRAMIENDPSHGRIVWPQAIVEHGTNDEFLGYTMSRIDLDSAANAFEYSMTEMDWDSSDSEQRSSVCQNLAVMVNAIHREGHAIGDFNHDNILIDEQQQVSLIDCDGFHITDGSATYPDDTYYPRYAPPEGRGGGELSNVREADRFSLGVHIFQMLMEGFHPYHAQGTNAVDGSMEDKLKGNKFPYVDYAGFDPIDRAPSIAEYERLPEEVQDLFRRCFTESGKNQSEGVVLGHTSPDRPEPEEWIGALPVPDPVPYQQPTLHETGVDVVTPDSGSKPAAKTDGSLSPVQPESRDSAPEESGGLEPVAPGQDEPPASDDESPDMTDD